MKRGKIDYRCSFCGKSQDKVHRLIAGPGGVYICDECIDLCREIIEEEQAMVTRLPSDSAQGAHWVATSGRARAEDAAPTSTQALPSAGKAEGDEAADTAPAYSIYQYQDLPMSLAPLVTELAAARATIERLANENGTLRERLRLRDAGTD